MTNKISYSLKTKQVLDALDHDHIPNRIAVLEKLRDSAQELVELLARCFIQPKDPTLLDNDDRQTSCRESTLARLALRLRQPTPFNMRP